MAILPSEQQMQDILAIAGTPADGAKVMLNLNAFHERARYEGEVPGGESADVSGRDAYIRYGLVATKVLERVGGRVLWEAASSRSAVGEDGERWDEVVAVWYPSLEAFVTLATDGELLAAHPHRAAGLERAVLVCCDSGPEPVLESNLPL
jgi:uncharacterized protein (DUF1330 family)